MEKKIGIAVEIIFLIVMGWRWSRGATSLYLDTDIGRDLNALADIFNKKMVWLGPQLSINYHASPVYYYQFMPLLWLFKGDPRSIWITNAVMGVLAVGLFGKGAFDRWGTKKAVLATVIVGLFPVMGTIAAHPGNGFTYALWLFLALDLMWLSAPVGICALGLGMAIAMHPAALCGLPALIFYWYKKGKRVKEAGMVILGLIVPWAPIIGFEIITKGFLIREWWKTRSIGGGWQPHYGFGLEIMGLFLVIIFLLSKKWGKWVLVGLLVWEIGNIRGMGEIKPAVRNIDRVEKTVQGVINKQEIDKNKPLAVISVLGKEVKTPAGDDYRFFLKMEGYTIADVFSYRQAPQLIIFNEIPDFTWQTYRSWEMSEFESKPVTLKSDTFINGTEAVYLVKQ